MGLVRCNKALVSELRYKVQNLVEGNWYEFRITDENNAGAGPTSDARPLIKCRDPVASPGVPGVIRVNDTTRTSIALTWSPPTFDGGSLVTGNNVYAQNIPQPAIALDGQDLLPQEVNSEAEEDDFARMNIDIVKLVNGSH